MVGLKFTQDSEHCIWPLYPAPPPDHHDDQGEDDAADEEHQAHRHQEDLHLHQGPAGAGPTHGKLGK